MSTNKGQMVMRNLSGLHYFPARHLHRLAYKATPRLRALWYRLVLGVPVAKIGCHVKLRGIAQFDFGRNLRIGDFCWIEAVERYAGVSFHPKFFIGDDVAMSDSSHISCALDIFIGGGTLIGSKVYIGDHSHGQTRDIAADALKVPPAERPLSDARPIFIGERCWIGDGAVILAGAQIPPGSIVAANSVVRTAADRPALLAGIPAKVIRFLD